MGKETRFIANLFFFLLGVASFWRAHIFDLDYPWPAASSGPLILGEFLNGHSTEVRDQVLDSTDINKVHILYHSYSMSTFFMTQFNVLISVSSKSKTISSFMAFYLNIVWLVSPLLRFYMFSIVGSTLYQVLALVLPWLRVQKSWFDSDLWHEITAPCWLVRESSPCGRKKNISTAALKSCAQSCFARRK